MSKERIVKAPNSIEVVRLRKGTFIGDTEYPNHLVHEAVDNFFDEIRNGHGSSAELYFNKDGSVFVMDNGRGLPLGETYVEESSKNYDTTELLFTKLHSGTKFDLDDYESIFGQNGIGLVAINALSEWVDIYIKDPKDKNITWNYKFEDSKLVKKDKINKPQPWSTIIGFKPSKDFFSNIEYDKESFFNRLLIAQSKMGKSTFKLDGKEIPKQSFEDCVRKFLELNPKTPLFSMDLQTQMKISSKKEDVFKPANIQVFITYEPGKTICTGDVNLRICGGSFLTSFQNLLKSTLPAKLDKKFGEFPDRYLLEGLRLYISLTIPEPAFDSQTKIRLTTPVKKELIDPLEVKLNKILANDYIKTTVEEILRRKITKTISSTATNKRISIGSKLKDCINSPGEVLYILEGDSADSTLQDIRCHYTEASLPLRGKVINVEKQSFDKISKNKEIKDLIEALGPKDSKRYEKVKILCDADCDGGHIVCLILLVFIKYRPDMIKDGCVSIIFPPLYGAKKNKDFKSIYDIKEVEKFREMGYTIRRFKGLGEMNSEELKSCLDAKIEYTVKFPKNTKNLEKLISIITDSDAKRKIMNKKENSFNVFLDFLLSDVKEKFLITEGE